MNLRLKSEVLHSRHLSIMSKYISGGLLYKNDIACLFLRKKKKSRVLS